MVFETFSLISTHTELEWKVEKVPTRKTKVVNFYHSADKTYAYFCSPEATLATSFNSGKRTSSGSVT